MRTTVWVIRDVLSSFLDDGRVESNCEVIGQVLNKFKLLAVNGLIINS